MYSYACHDLNIYVVVLQLISQWIYFILLNFKFIILLELLLPILCYINDIFIWYHVPYKSKHTVTVNSKKIELA